MWSILVIALMVGGSFWLVLPQYTFPLYPSDWIEDLITVNFDEDLRGKTFLELVPPAKRMAARAGYASNPIYDEILAWLRVLKLNGLVSIPDAASIHSRTGNQLLRISSGVGMWAYHVWSDHVRCGNVRCWFLCLDATTASSVLVIADAELIVRRNRAGCYCHDWRSPN